MLRTQLPEDWIDVIFDDVWRLLELDPVVLDVLTRREMPETLVVRARHVRERSHLLRRERAVRDVHAQHVGMELQVQAVHQAQRPELLLGEFALEATAHLVAGFRDPLLGDRGVEVVVNIHGYSALMDLLRSRRTVGPVARMTSRMCAGVCPGVGCTSTTFTSITRLAA